jgi:hypothetical protein
MPARTNRGDRRDTRRRRRDRAQLLSYLKLGGYRLGYLLNFNVKMLKGGICRLANGL